jgi:tRNA (adenine57-N1/adenine58-N1)-methyltransferase
MEKIKENEWVLIRVGEKRYMKKVEKEKTFSFKGGHIKFSEIIGKPFGISIGKALILKPTLEEIILYGIKRETQIIYPKDSFYICKKLNLIEGKKVLEFGSGSGALTLVLSSCVGNNGKVVSYEKEERIYKVAQKNIENFAVFRNIELINEEFKGENHKENEFDAIFVDTREPYPYIKSLWKILKPSAPIGFLLPTTNQVQELLRVLQPYFGDIEILEILVRHYKINPERFRPEDTMIGHTAYLLFAKKILMEN